MEKINFSQKVKSINFATQRTFSMKNAFGYATRVWLTAVIITPIVMIGYRAGVLASPWFSIIVILFGGIYSLPSWLILSCIIWHLNDLSIGIVGKKLLLTIISILLVWLPFWCVDFFGEEAPGLFGKNGVYILCVTYWIVITFGIWFYELNPNFTKSNSDQLNQIS